MSGVGFFLALFLVLGIVYLILSPNKPGARPNLKIDRFKTDKIKALVMFVSDITPPKTIEHTLAYQVLKQLTDANNNQPKYIWLVHTEFGGENSSTANTEKLIQMFQGNSKVSIQTKVITNVFDTSEAFDVVSSIITDDKLPVAVHDTLCDCTAGPKPFTLGLALAGLGKARLIYYPSDGGMEYIELDASALLKSA